MNKELYYQDISFSNIIIKIDEKNKVYDSLKLLEYVGINSIMVHI